MVVDVLSRSFGETRCECVRYHSGDHLLDQLVRATSIRDQSRHLQLGVEVDESLPPLLPAENECPLSVVRVWAMSSFQPPE